MSTRREPYCRSFKQGKICNRKRRSANKRLIPPGVCVLLLRFAVLYFEPTTAFENGYTRTVRLPSFLSFFFMLCHLAPSPLARSVRVAGPFSTSSLPLTALRWAAAAAAAASVVASAAAAASAASAAVYLLLLPPPSGAGNVTPLPLAALRTCAGRCAARAARRQALPSQHSCLPVLSLSNRNPPTPPPAPALTARPACIPPPTKFSTLHPTHPTPSIAAVSRARGGGGHGPPCPSRTRTRPRPAVTAATGPARVRGAVPRGAD